MIIFMIRGFSLRKLYVEPSLIKDENSTATAPKYQTNWEFLACLSCQPEYRTKAMLDKFKTFTLESEVQREIDDRESWPHFRKNFVNKFLQEKERQKSMLRPRGGGCGEAGLKSKTNSF